MTRRKQYEGGRLVVDTRRRRIGRKLYDPRYRVTIIKQGIALANQNNFIGQELLSCTSCPIRVSASNNRPPLPDVLSMP